MVLIETSDESAVSQEPARLSRLRIPRNVGLDELVQAVEPDFDVRAFAVGALAAGTDAVGGKEVVVLVDVKMIIPQVAGRYGQQPPCVAPVLNIHSGSALLPHEGII